MLTGIFDPPPTGVSLPIGHLVGLVPSVLGVTGLAVVGLRRSGSRTGPAGLRELCAGVAMSRATSSPQAGFSGRGRQC